MVVLDRDRSSSDWKSRAWAAWLKLVRKVEWVEGGEMPNENLLESRQFQRELFGSTTDQTTCTKLYYRYSLVFHPDKQYTNCKAAFQLFEAVYRRQLTRCLCRFPGCHNGPRVRGYCLVHPRCEFTSTSLDDDDDILDLCEKACYVNGSGGHEKYCLDHQRRGGD